MTASPISISPRPQPRDRPYWLAWPSIAGIGPNRIKQLFLQFGSLKAAWQSSAAELLQVEGIGLMLADAIAGQRDRLEVEIVAEQMTAYLPHNVDTITPADINYPPMLWEIPDPPPLLYVTGNLRVWSPTIAIVGTRSPSSYGRRWAAKIGQGLAESGYTIASRIGTGN